MLWLCCTKASHCICKNAILSVSEHLYQAAFENKIAKHTGRATCDVKWSHYFVMLFAISLTAHFCNSRATCTGYHGYLQSLQWLLVTMVIKYWQPWLHNTDCHGYLILVTMVTLFWLPFIFDTDNHGYLMLNTLDTWC